MIAPYHLLYFNTPFSYMTQSKRFNAYTLLNGVGYSTTGVNEGYSFVAFYLNTNIMNMTLLANHQSADNS
ncbi:hypothetical protein EYC80_001127 [Monilinia laxa]|uniref:Uncharacterized protein n=1 Tax=Monilinia laxa TaxID=61186 RepID=A0A5N6K8B3_MONLA|nr:hypothetical protein EYC80_001127 [Monilinia laxa]